MGIYDEDAATALELIQDSGTTLTITRLVPGTPAAGDRPATAPIKITAVVFGVIFPLDLALQSMGLAATKYSDQSLIKETQLVAFVAGTGMTVTRDDAQPFSGAFSPDAGDVVAGIAQLLTVVGNNPLAPDAGTPILHVVFLKS